MLAHSLCDIRAKRQVIARTFSAFQHDLEMLKNFVARVFTRAIDSRISTGSPSKRLSVLSMLPERLQPATNLDAKLPHPCAEKHWPNEENRT